jgi:hypothetical protein
MDPASWVEDKPIQDMPIEHDWRGNCKFTVAHDVNLGVIIDRIDRVVSDISNINAKLEIVEKINHWCITQDDYDRKARELKERQTEIALRVEQHQQGEGDYRTTLESLISVASRAAEIFECSKTEQKRQLIAFVFSNLRLKGKKLEFSLRSPFDLMVNRANYTSWLGDLDSNQD